MTHTVVAGPGSPSQPLMKSGTRALLASGVVGGPLFVGVTLAQMLTRDGFDPRLHPLSLLSTGGPGWIQITNFIIAGALFLGCAIGMSKALYPGRASTWGPRLIGAFGVSLIWSGVFVADPYRGFPAGVAESDQASWHGVLHTIGPIAAYVTLLVACVVFALRFARLRQRGWMAYTIATAAVSFVAVNMAMPADDFRIMLAGGSLLWLWTSAIALHVLNRAELR